MSNTNQNRSTAPELAVHYSATTPPMLHTDTHSADAAAGPALPAVASVVVVLVVVLAGVALVRRRARGDQMERICACVARNCGLDARECAVLRRVARAGSDLHPAVLAVTPSAMGHAIDRGEHTGRLKARDVRAAIALAARLDWTRTPRASQATAPLRAPRVQSRGAGDGAPSGSSPRSLSAMSA